MRVGSLVYATDQGLGVLAKAFFDGGIVTHPMIVQHAHYPTHSEWYPGAPSVPIRELGRYRQMLQDYCLTLDILLLFETPFDWSLVEFCRRKGIRVLLMPMHECTPEILPSPPDAFLCPSLLDLRCFVEDRRQCAPYPETFVEYRGKYGAKCYWTPVPVQVPWKLRQKVEVFVHNAGHGGLRSRNGTGTLLDAMYHLKSDAKVILRSQDPLKWGAVDDPRLEVRVQPRLSMEELWGEGDAFVFPEKFNGLSLPLQEARAAGMLVIATDRFPMNEWLPREYLAVPHAYSEERVAHGWMPFQEANVHPADLARKMDEAFGKDISQYSMEGQLWAQSMSWATFGPKYKELLCKL